MQFEQSRKQTVESVGCTWTGVDCPDLYKRCPFHTNSFSEVCVFVVIENALIDSHPHYHFDAFSIILTKMLENDKIACCDVSRTLCACYKHTRLRYFRSSFSFWCVFDCSHYWRYVCVFVFFNSVFKSMCFRRKRSASECTRFKTCIRPPIRAICKTVMYMEILCVCIFLSIFSVICRDEQGQVLVLKDVWKVKSSFYKNY